MQAVSILSGSSKSVIDFSGVNKASSKEGSLSGLFKSYTKGASSQDRISNLVERKQSITDLKYEYQQRAAEKGWDQETIDAKLAEYDGMIAEIDSQIAGIRQDEMKKATNNTDKDNTVNETNTGDVSNTAMQTKDSTVLASDKLLEAFSSAQNTEEHMEVIQLVSNALKTEALSYKPSMAFEGDAEKYAQLTAKADGLQNDLAEMNQEAQDCINQITTDDSQNTEPKTAQEQAVEYYKNTVDAYIGNEKSRDNFDVLA